MSDEERPGLRERKKQAKREALSAAALRLALEHGPDNVRVDDIAEAAGVSPRTWNNYFSSREQAIMVALTAERALRVGAAVRDRPAGEPLDRAVIAAVVEQYADEHQPDAVALGLISASPGLRAEFLATIAAIEHPLAAAIAARTTDDPSSDDPSSDDPSSDDPATDDLAPAVLAAAVSAAARVAAQRWLREPDGSFAALLEAALERLAPALSHV